jgi:hypothetical protein
MRPRFLSFVLATTVALAAQAFDLGTPQAKLDAFVRMRGDATGSDVYTDWQVTAFAVIPGQRAQPIFRLDGFNVGRMEKQADGGYRWLSREVAYYRDIASGRILDKWENPFTKETNEVLHVINDPVNLAFPPADKTPPHRALPFVVRGEDVFLQLDVPLAYPNPIQPDAFPAESTGPTYFASEHFMYFAKTRDVADSKLTSVPITYAWLRQGPWLPWMKMGTRPGYVLYSGQGKKVAATQLDPVVREYTEKHHPAFMKAPAEWSQPNETSWTYYRKKRSAK